MSRRRPTIDENPLAGRFRVARDPAQAATPEPPLSPAGAPATAGAPAPTQPPPDPATEPATQPASGPASQLPTHVGSQPAGQLAGEQADQAGAALTTSMLRRRGGNPWKQWAPTGLRLPRFLAEHYRSEKALTAGEMEIQERVARAVYFYESHGAPLEPDYVPPGAAARFEEAWVDAGGVPGQMENYRPK